MKSRFINIILLSLIFTCFSFGAIYDDNYSPFKNENNATKINIFMYGDFQEIIRFDMLKISDKQIDEDSKIYFNKIIKTIKEYNQQGKDIRVSIIGHANKWENLFSTSIDKNASYNLSKSYADSVQNSIVKNGIDENITVVEARGARDMSSDGVMLSIYVLIPSK